jgi:hypothetical protein
VEYVPNEVQFLVMVGCLFVEFPPQRFPSSFSFTHESFNNLFRHGTWKGTFEVFEGVFVYREMIHYSHCNFAFTT